MGTDKWKKKLEINKIKNLRKHCEVYSGLFFSNSTEVVFLELWLIKCKFRYKNRQIITKVTFFKTIFKTGKGKGKGWHVMLLTSSIAQREGVD